MARRVFSSNHIVRLTSDMLEGFDELEFLNCPELVFIPKIPGTVKKINFTYCKKLITLPDIPEGVEELAIKRCEAFEYLPNIPSTVKKINFSYCPELKIIPPIPEGVEELDFCGCTALKSIPNISSAAKKINFAYCRKLKTIPPIPEGVLELNLSGRNKLISTQKLLTRLAVLEDNGCDIRYPNHFDGNVQVTQAKARLEAISQEYKKLSNTEALNPIPKTTVLLHRFLSESTGQRGTIKEVVLVTTPVLDVLEQKPKLLKVVEEVAINFLAGCVNQPVAGWSEISALVSIAKASSMVEKVEAAKHLLVNDQIKGFVAGSHLGIAFEVEAGNALLREVHKKLLKEGDIAKPWLSVPNSIAHEESIRYWLTPEKVQEFYDQIKPLVQKKPLEIIETLCEGVHCKNWGRIVFAPEAEVMEKKCEEEKKSLWSVIEGMAEGYLKENKLVEFKGLDNKHEKIFAQTIKVLTVAVLPTTNENSTVAPSPSLSSVIAETLSKPIAIDQNNR